MTSPNSNPTPVRLFYSYSHKDEAYRDELEEHLSLLKRQGLIHSWHDRRISAGQEWQGVIDENLEAANVILCLVSAAFLASDYCYDIEMKRALEKHEKGAARVIPIIIRPIDWSGAPFSKLQALPKDAKPVSSWSNRDEAWTDVAKGVRKAIGELPSSRTQEQKTEEPKPAKAEQRTEIELKQLEVKKAPKEESKPAEKPKPTAPSYDRTGRFTGTAHNITYNIQGKCFLEISKIAGQTVSARFGFSEGLHAKGDLVGTINEKHQLELVGIISSLQTGSFDCRIVCRFVDADNIQGEYNLDPRAWNFLSSNQNGKLSLTRE